MDSIKLKGMKKFIILLGLAVPLLLAQTAWADLVTTSGFDQRGISIVNYSTIPPTGTDIDYTQSAPSGGVYRGDFNQGMTDPLGATASQNSFVTASAQSLFAQGSGQATSDTSLCASGSGWLLNFVTTVSSTYTLSGSLVCLAPPPNWGAMTYLNFYGVFLSDSPGSFAQSGTLAPGGYMIQAMASAQQGAQGPGTGGNESWDFTLTVTPESSPVPIPPSLMLLGSGLLGLAGWRRFRKI